jgi:hypothetical protein
MGGSQLLSRKKSGSLELWIGNLSRVEVDSHAALQNAQVSPIAGMPLIVIEEP